MNRGVLIAPLHHGAHVAGDQAGGRDRHTGVFAGAVRGRLAQSWPKLRALG